MKKVLLIAYHFPPLAGSSGIQRSLRFAQQLPQFGWQPLVLSAHPRAYERCSDELLDQIPPGMPVRRAFALDAARHLSLRGRYAGFTARPDRWVSWRFDALRQGLAMIREFRPDAIWSTYPIATAHLIGRGLMQRSGLPWIADFRDPMAQDGYPSDPKVWQSFKDIESTALAEARFCTFTTPSAARGYGLRYPAAAERIATLENGYDEESFAGLGEFERKPLNPGALTLLHSGIVYPEERDPTQLIEALALLAARGQIAPGRFRLRFRAAVHEQLLRDLATRHGVADYIELLPPLPYTEALREMMCADALLVLQAANCNEQVPAKLYE
ncbi:MAG TPA: glycosyltransferase, partial [Roseateles sp.]|nr:glycosyltransferase [Roseateles sp.]